MKKSKLSVLVVGAVLGSFIGVSNVYGISVTVPTAARIVAALAAVSSANLNFGSIASSASAGTVKYAVAGSRTASGGVSLVSGGGETLGGVNVTAGEANAVCAISYPASVTLTSGANSMTVDNFTGAGNGNSPTTVTLNGSGTGTFQIGGIVNVAANQATGTYNGNLSVTVVYQ